MEFPKITIITPSYNQGQYIEQTITSVLDQNYPNLEYIIIDGGSTDNTIDIIKKYEEKITYWISEKDKGQSDAINKGFEKATGEIINWLNSDDFLEDKCLFKIAESFKNPTIMAVTAVVCNFIEDGEAWNERTPVFNSPAEYIAFSFNNQPGTFFRKSVWNKYFPLPEQLHFTMDQYLWFCFWLEHSISNLKNEDYATTYFRRHSNSKTTLSDATFLFNTLGKKFFNDHHLIFWSFFEDQPEGKILSKYFFDGFDFSRQKIKFPKLSNSLTLTRAIFHHYLLVLIKEDYKHGFFKRLKEGINTIDSNILEAKYVDELERIRKKSRFFLLTQAYRKIYWKLKN